ncbi:MAG: DUF4261 domain-containing protein [Planctomycetales bacterium]|nr:DUF4261 domain-containing protein [Planctomycetales bacterium]
MDRTEVGQQRVGEPISALIDAILNSIQKAAWQDFDIRPLLYYTEKMVGKWLLHYIDQSLSDRQLLAISAEEVQTPALLLIRDMFRHHSRLIRPRTQDVSWVESLFREVAAELQLPTGPLDDEGKPHAPGDTDGKEWAERLSAPLGLPAFHLLVIHDAVVSGIEEELGEIPAAELVEEGGPLIGIVAFRDVNIIDPVELVHDFARHVGDINVGTDIEGEEGTISFTLNGNATFLSVQSMPIPWSELEGPCETAWWWPQAAKELSRHQAMVLIALNGQLGTVSERHIQLTRLVAHVSALQGAIGIFWSAAGLVHEPSQFQEIAAGLSPQELEPQLWVDMRVEKNEDGSYRFFTDGLTAFNQPEIEIDYTKRDPDHVYQTCYSVIRQAITSGHQLQQGETIELAPDTIIQVKHAPSMWERDGPVVKLEFT